MEQHCESIDYVIEEEKTTPSITELLFRALINRAEQTPIKGAEAMSLVK